ncbi:hypothetical protein TTHERM_00287950 (macronuclear) [Tetrahymena thermophila SB210]|uniref:Uncharacterized protein n=1 Tax=Tetrahymena thermophila (strain SB210) TaxID=312017 RepID=I7M8K7_TETTS|nr:hypothetical protein TTHERM_00287950 [Tetrahymena thermophila SB210]EAR98366.2 hypothetical protein TTHERM_00287950 [Tetrahymena thermophila SB210]|eukprot:XP_001018611.2 hypothetical protein TTHERM_00287950 [Tetrahymena thermophila SB210]
MHLNSNTDSRRFLENNGFSGNVQREPAQRYGPPIIWGTPDKTVLQTKDTNIDYQQQYHHGIDHGDIKNNNRSISPISKQAMQAPSSPYTSNSPFKKITGIKKTPNGKQASFHQHQNSNLSGHGANQINNSNYYNNSQETTLNTTDASFTQFLNQTANRSILAADLSNISQQQQNPQSQRQTRQAASMHCQAQMNYKSPQNTHASKVIQGGLANIKGNSYTTQSKSNYTPYTPNYHQASQSRQHHSVYASPMTVQNNSQYLNDSQQSYNRNKNGQIRKEQQGVQLYNNMVNDSSSNHGNSSQNSVYQTDESNENIRLNSMASARGHNKNLSCFAQQSVYQQNNHNNSVNDNFTTIATKQINQIENFFSNPRSYSNLNQTPTSSNSNNNSSSMTPTYKQQNNSGIITPRQLPKHTPDNQERILSNLNSQMNNNRHASSYNLMNNNFNANTPTNHKHQNSCYQNFEFYGNNLSNPSASPQPQIGLNVEQSIPSQIGHSKSQSLHQQRSAQSITSGSINQSNFLQNSSFINHINNKQFDSKSTFNPSSNFGSIAQNKSGFFNSQSSFLNSNGGFLSQAESQSGNYLQGIQNNSQQQYMPNSVVQLNANATINGMLGQQYQQGNVLSKGPQLQKIIDDLKENIVKDLESLTNKLYKESEQIMNNSCNQPGINIYDSIQNAPIKLAEFNIGDDKKIRFSFSGKEVITQITSTNMKLKKDIKENNEDVISTYKTPLNSSQFLSPQQQQLLTEQIINSGFGQMGIHHTPKNSSKANDSSTALHTFSSPQSVDESQTSVSQKKAINTAPTLSPNNIKRPNIFKNPSKLFEKGQKENKNGNSFQSSINGEKEETPSNRNDTSTQNNSKIYNFEESVRITYAQQSQGEEKLFEEFFKNNESQESKQSNVCLNVDQNSALTMIPEPENKFKHATYKASAQNQNNNNSAQNQQKEFIQFIKPVIANEKNEKQTIKDDKQLETNNKIVTPIQVDKNNKELQKQNDQNSASTPQKKEQKLNTEESENAPGKQTPCFQSSKSKRSNKNNIQQKTSSDEKNGSQHLTPFCLKFDNINKTLKSSTSSGSELNTLDQKDSNSQMQLSSKNALIISNIQSEEQYESELQSLTQNLSIQNKNDNLSDQDDVVLRTDNTDQLSEGSPKLPIYCSNKKSNKKDHNNSSKNKIPLGQLQNQLEHIHEKECESGNSTPNAQISQNQSNVYSDQDEKKKKSQFQEYLHSGSSKIILKEDQHNQMKNSQTSATNSQINSNNSLNQKQIENIHYNSNNNNSPLLQVPSSKMEQSMVQDHCSYRGSAKSNHSSSSSSAQNRYQDSAVSSRKQSFVENANDSSYLNNSNIHINTAINNNNNNNSFVSTPGSNLKSSRYQQNMFNTPNNNNLNNTSLRSKKIDEYSQGKNQNTFNINSNNVSSLSNNQHTSSASNLLNGTNIRFSTYLKQFEETKSQQTQNQGLVFDNKNFNSNISSNNTSYTSSQTPNNLNISNYSSQPRNQQLQITSPVSNTNITPRQPLFKNKSNLTLFQEYEAKMKTPTKQTEADLNVSQNSVVSGKNNIQQVLSKPNTPSQSKIALNNAQMNKLQEVKQKQLEGNEDEVHTSRENPLEQIRENTNNTQENEDSHFSAFQNPPSNRPSASKKLSFLDNHNNSLHKHPLSNTEPKKEAPKTLVIDSALDQSSQQNFYNRTTPTQDKFVINKDLYYVPLAHETQSHQKDADKKGAQNNEKEENSSVSSFKQNTQPTSSTFYLSSRSNFYESTQKLIEDSVIIQNKKNDLSNGNISKYSYSSSHSKSSNNNSNNKNISDQDEKRSENNSRILRNPIDDDDDAILNIGENLESNQLISNNKEIPSSQVNSTPEKIKKNSPNQQQADPNSIKPNPQQTKESQNENTYISNFESQTIISEIQDKKKQISSEEDTPSSTVLFNDNSESSQKKRQQFTFNIKNESNTEDIGICRNLKQEIDTDYQFQEFGSKRSSQEEESASEQTSSDLIIGESKQAQQQTSSLLHSQTTPNIQLCKNTSIDIEIQNKNSYPMKEFTFSANSSTSINNEAHTNNSFSKSQSHQQLSKVISSSIQVEDEDGCEITVSIVSHKRSSINQSKTILKKSLMGSPTSSALAKASSVKKSQRRISFKDKIEEVYNFEPEDRSTSRSPISSKLPRSQLRVNLKKEPYFDSIKKFPNIQKDPTYYQQYKNKNASNTSWTLEEKSNQNETSLNSDNSSLKNKNTTSQEESKPPSYLIQRRESSGQLNNIDEFGNSRSFRPLCFTPGGSNSSKKQTKITFLEYSKINKIGENK